MAQPNQLDPPSSGAGDNNEGGDEQSAAALQSPASERHSLEKSQ